MNQNLHEIPARGAQMFAADTQNQSFQLRTRDIGIADALRDALVGNDLREQRQLLRPLIQGIGLPRQPEDGFSVRSRDGDVFSHTAALQFGLHGAQQIGMRFSVDFTAQDFFRPGHCQRSNLRPQRFLGAQHFLIDFRLGTRD